MPYSHKIKTKMIWAPKEKKEVYQKKPFAIPERTEPSICRLFDGTEIEIAKDIPIRDEPVSFEVMKNVQFPGILAIIKEMENENKRIQNEKRLKVENLPRRVDTLNKVYEESQPLIEVNQTPKLVKGLPTIFPRQKGSFLRAVQSVTNVIQRQFSDNSSVGREMCETLLKEELDADAETIQFSRDPTPPPFVIPEHKIDETSFKSCDSVTTNSSADRPSIDGSTDSADSPKLPVNDENQKPQNKKPCRRKRTKGNPKKKST